MGDFDVFWKLDHLSPACLLEGLQRLLRTQRRSLAELVAHLGEVEERRLHLEAACGSLFAYCVQRLGMSEDEACRRIELARLARRFPALFPELASGAIGLSVALVLKAVLTEGNHMALVAAARGASLARARELVAECCPRPDVASQVRKLPEPRSTPSAESAAPVAPPEPQPGLPAAQTWSGVTDESARSLPVERALSVATNSAHAPMGASARSAQRIEPLSPQRYRIQFTADAELKRKLELARDLLRHALPSGDFAPIVSRALDLLIDDVKRSRFGERKRKGSHASSSPDGGARPTAARRARNDSAAPPGTPQRESMPSSADAAPLSDAVRPAAPPLAAPTREPTQSSEASATPSRNAEAIANATRHSRRRISCAARRTVLERDGLGCSHVAADGTRCGSTAWLELDHHEPVGRGGGSQPENVRLLCRAHNQWAAERVYGRRHIAHAVDARRRTAHTEPPPRGTV